MAVFRSVGMKAAPGKEAEFDQMTSGSSVDMSNIEGLQFWASFSPSLGNMSSVNIFASQAHCDAFKANMRAKMMEKFKGIMGGQNYMVEGGLLNQQSSGKKVAAGMAMRNVSYKCKQGQEGPFSQMAGGMYNSPMPTGMVFRAYMMSDARTMNSISVFEDMAALDAYNAEVRAKYASQMAAMMEGPVYDEKGIVKNAVGPKGDGGDACCGCVVQ